VPRGRPKGSKNKPKTFEQKVRDARRRGAPDDLPIYDSTKPLAERLCRPAPEMVVLHTLNPDWTWTEGDSGKPALGFLLPHGPALADPRHDEDGGFHPTDDCILWTLVNRAVELGLPAAGDKFFYWCMHEPAPVVRVNLQAIEGGAK